MWRSANLGGLVVVFYWEALFPSEPPLPPAKHFRRVKLRNVDLEQCEEMRKMDLLQLFPLKPEDRCGTGLCADDFLEHPIVFVERFWKCRDSLMLVADRVLGDRKVATAVVESCFRRACSEPPRFASEGAFGCWLLRILIEESLQERHRRRWVPKGHCHQSLTGSAEREGTLGQLDDFWCLDNAV